MSFWIAGGPQYFGILWWCFFFFFDADGVFNDWLLLSVAVVFSELCLDVSQYFSIPVVLLISSMLILFASWVCVVELKRFSFCRRGVPAVVALSWLFDPDVRSPLSSSS